ncbi:MAG: twin-arginine translocase subunit TatC [Aureispira sp.]|nr:twin-arginine translocase subunit TatC [Aureispira sp.]
MATETTEERIEEVEDGVREMTFVEHLEELRMHIMRSVIVIVAVAIVVFFATDIILTKVIFAPIQSDFLTYKVFCALSHKIGLEGALCYDPTTIKLITLDMGEAFLLHIKICFFGGLIVSFPYVLWEAWKFIRPALYNNEINATRGVVSVSSFLFLLGVCFGYFVMAPFAINFLVNYNLPMINDGGNMIKATSYINYMIMFTIPTGVLFELPIVVYYLSKIGLVTDAGMRTYRRHAIIAILLLAAVVTPPDVMTQIIIGIPIYFLYEISINIAAKQTKKREQEMSS